jgi:aminoglycoside/choline kinase family phosphotransferase
MTDMRLQQASAWLNNSLRLPVKMIKPLAGDASFRRYFRVHLPDVCYVLMDAPPEREDCHPFAAIDRQFVKSGIHAPAIIAEDFAQGFLLLEDFGDQLFLSAVNQENVDELYRLALQTLTRLQQIKSIANYKLPVFDSAMMMREMMLFQDWFILNKLDYPLQAHEKTLLKETFEFIAAKIETFQYTCVHRDYHSRNLMILKSNELGILDFQDAVWGPVTYDAISLLKDCYISWPRDKVIDLLGYYHQMLVATGIVSDKTFSDFTAEFDWVGVQRHLKVVGIFSRLAIRDHKPGYLKDIPLAMRYLTEALNQFVELNDFNTWLREAILPVYQDVILATHVL